MRSPETTTNWKQKLISIVTMLATVSLGLAFFKWSGAAKALPDSQPALPPEHKLVMNLISLFLILLIVYIAIGVYPRYMGGNA